MSSLTKVTVELTLAPPAKYRYCQVLAFQYLTGFLLQHFSVLWYDSVFEQTFPLSVSSQMTSTSPS
jgi:hypothetical protein